VKGKKTEEKEEKSKRWLFSNESWRRRRKKCEI